MGFEIKLVDNINQQNPLPVLPFNALGGTVTCSYEFEYKREIQVLPAIHGSGEFSSDSQTMEQLDVVIGEEIPNVLAEVSATYNWSKLLNAYFNQYYEVDDGFRYGIYGMKASDLAPFFRKTIEAIGEVPPASSYYDASLGNIKSLFVILLGWCVQQPKGLFVTH